MSQDLDTQHFGDPSEPGAPGHQQWLRQERTQTYRDMVGMAAFIVGRGDAGFHEFDEWLAAVTQSTTIHTNGSGA